MVKKPTLKKKAADVPVQETAPEETPKIEKPKRATKETVKKSVITVDNKQPKGERETIVKDESETTGQVVTTEPTRRVGMSKTMTINMGNYQSAKIGVWIERTIPDNNRDEATTITEISERLDEYLKVEVSDLQK